MVHLGNPQFPLHYEEIVKAAKESNVALEINNSSLKGSRKGSKPNCKKIAELCKKYDCLISLGTDSHISYDIGEFDEAISLLNDINFPESNIINSSVEKSELRESLMIGDNWDADITGACHVGMHQAFYNVSGRTEFPFRATYHIQSLKDLMDFL